MSAFLKSFSYAFKGIGAALKQRNMKIIFISAVLTIIAALVLKVRSTDWCMLLLCIGAVISLEMMNCAIEEIVNFISPGFHEKAGKIKDISAGAVLIFSIISFIIGILILGKYFLEFIYNTTNNQ
jgi:diacylglycerol kinase